MEHPGALAPEEATQLVERLDQVLLDLVADRITVTEANRITREVGVVLARLERELRDLKRGAREP